MPSFKPKTNKKIKFNKKSTVTIDTKHKEFLNEFSKDDYDRLPKLKYEKLQLKEQLLKDDDILSLEQRLDIEDKIKEISEKIK